MGNTLVIFRRELASYFASPLAYLYIMIFLALSGGLTFFLGGFLERGQANLQPFFQFHPWLYLFLIPAIGMRLWAEERKSGSIEFLMTLPISTGQAVVGKFFAAWVFTGIALLLTFPIWLTVNYLGQPDNGVILSAYLGSWLMAGGYLAISACVSALTRNQVIAFVVGAGICFLFLMSGIELIQAAFRGWVSDAMLQTLADISFLTNFHAIGQGVIDLRHLIYFVSMIGGCLVINTAIIELKKGA